MRTVHYGMANHNEKFSLICYHKSMVNIVALHCTVEEAKKSWRLKRTKTWELNPRPNFVHCALVFTQFRVKLNIIYIYCLDCSPSAALHTQTLCQDYPRYIRLIWLFLNILPVNRWPRITYPLRINPTYPKAGLSILKVCWVHLSGSGGNVLPYMP